MPQDDRVAFDAQLIQRLRADDESALETAMQRYLDDIVGIAFHYVRTPDVASDVAQSVFIQMWERRHTLKADGNLAGYLRRSARHAALNMLRRDDAHARLEQNLANEYTVLRPHDDNTALRTIEAEEFNRRLRTALTTLSPRVREVALLYHERGLEPGEIAAMLEVAPQTVYNQLRTAMKALIQAFRP